MTIPSLNEIREARETLGDMVLETPVWPWRGREKDQAIGASTQVLLKLELFQYTGTFKPRGALVNALALSTEETKRGFTAVSAGNHAIAVAFAANRVSTTAKVVMPKTASALRVRRCREYGAEVILAEDVHRAFDEVERIQRDEGRVFIHPFEGRRTVVGTATVGLEWCRQAGELDAVIVPIGGGGLIAGVATAVKAQQPRCMVFGVEPTGADSMYRSFASGKPEKLERVTTIADSLGAPYALPYTFEICRRFVDEIVLISDADIRQAMRLLFLGMKMAVEPAGAAATAALQGPLRERLAGKRVGVIVCGANISEAEFAREVAPEQ